MALAIEHFFGVYMLYCQNPKYKGRIYIGYTVDPNRRIKQHNKGREAGGAFRTNKKGPWTMVMIIHNFPNSISALRFEWAWQNPHKSRRLSHVPNKKARESVFEFRLRVLSEMLRAGPWNRLPLTIRWLDEEFRREFPIDKLPPVHMPICSGAVISQKLPANSKSNTGNKSASEACKLCFKHIERVKIRCINADCDLVSHITCLAPFFLDEGEYVPVEGQCPQCAQNFLWGDIVRKYKGCNVSTEINCGNANDFYSSDSE